MITLEQFKKAYMTKKGTLYGINNAFEIVEFFPWVYEVRGETVEGGFDDFYNVRKTTFFKASIGSTDHEYFQAERCFKTKSQAREGLKKLLEKKIEEVKNDR